MQKKYLSWDEKWVGMPMPKGIRVDWNEISDSDQDLWVDVLDNEWRSELAETLAEKGGNSLPLYNLWTSVFSEYSEMVLLTVTLRVRHGGIIEQVEVDGFMASHARPSSICPSFREKYQIACLLKKLAE